MNGRARVVTLAAFALVLLACVLRYRPPAPAPADAPAASFSAVRAQRIQAELSAHGTRAVGSAGHERARELLAGELTHLGWTTDLRKGVSCGGHDACAHVTNLVATWPGTDPAAQTVLLMAHYDSVPCSPGAGDDGFGAAAAIEAARAIAAGPPLRRGVVLLLSDAEEAGLLGAHLFTREDPRFASVGAVVNVDSRGSGGPSAMFETSAGNADLVARFGEAVDRPVTSSLFYEIYRRMPNDTDFTTVRGVKRGVNLANIGRVARYHTSRDTFAEADPGTLQHHGEQALAMVRSFASAGPELEHPAGGDAVWFDVLALFVARWPAGLTLPLALLSLVLAGLNAARRRRELTVRAMAAPLSALASALVAAFAVGGLLQGAGALPVPWVAHPLPALAAMHLACVVAGLLGARLTAGPGATPGGIACGAWLAWSLVAVLLAVKVPGASFLFVVPALVAGAAALLGAEVGAALPAVVAAVLWLPIALLVYDGLGLFLPVVACVPAAFLVSAVTPLFARRPHAEAAETEATALRWRRLAAVGGLLVAALTVTSIAVPPYSAEVPQRVNVVFRQDAGEARVFVEAAWSVRAWGRAPAAMVGALGDPAHVTSEPPWRWSPALPSAPVPRVDLAPPVVSVTSDASGALTVHVRSARGATTFAVLFPQGAPPGAITVDGQLATARSGAVFLRGVPPEGATLRFARGTGGRVAVSVVDVTTGLPEGSPVANAVRAARPEEAVETQEGDVTVVATAASL
ncbi:MAG: Peptidase, family [Labilithrix sp.]|nr:Peptidase, family [Labilithrix sp.]